MRTKILLYNNGERKALYKELLSFLQSLGFEINETNSVTDLTNIVCDMVLICDKRSCNKFRKLNLNIPLLYVLTSDNFCSDMIFDSSLFYHVLMINTCERIYSNSFVTRFPFLCVVKDMVPIIEERKYARLLVDIESENSLINLLPLLNTYVDYEIDILTYKPYRFKDIVNAHIHLSSDKNRERLIEEADALIAEGYTALKGVMQQKPVFVVGECGFGGLVEKDNVKEQYRTGFSGRLGGVKNEYLPLPMIDYEIKKVLNGQIGGWKETAEVLCECCRETSDRFCQLVSFFANLSRQKGEVFLQKNHYMDYIEGDEANYWVVDKVYRKLLLEIDEKEKRLVDCFDSPRQLSSVYKEMEKDMTDEEIEKSVDELLKYKLLDYCIYETVGTEL